jgi:hypothetical protein
VLHGPKPPRTGKRGRPRKKGAQLGTCAQVAAAAAWQAVTIHAYGQDATVQVAEAEALWHGSFKHAPGRLVLVRDPGSAKPYDLGLFTLDTAATAVQVIERYSWRWPIEPSNATGKQILGVGDACNRVRAAVERTVPFGFLPQSLLIVSALQVFLQATTNRPPTDEQQFFVDSRNDAENEPGGAILGALVDHLLQYAQP